MNDYSKKKKVSNCYLQKFENSEDKSEFKINIISNDNISPIEKIDNY